MGRSIEDDEESASGSQHPGVVSRIPSYCLALPPILSTAFN